MAVALTKIVDGKPAISDTLTNEQVVKCPVYGAAYRLADSDEEWHRLNHWLPVAERAIRLDHLRKHQAESLGLEWKPVRRKR